MAYTLIASVAAFSPGGGGTFTSGAIDTTGATLLIVCSADNGTVPTLTDSKGNTWTLARRYAPFGASSVMYYCWSAPTVGSGHTFTMTGTAFNGSAQMWAFSGSQTTSAPLDQGNEDFAFASTTVQPGPITPTTDGQLVMTHCDYDTGGPPTIDLGYATPVGSNGSGGQYLGSHSSYLIQTTAGSTDPTWTTAAGTNRYSIIESFKAAPAGRVTHNTRPQPLGTEIGMNWGGGA